MKLLIQPDDGAAPLIKVLSGASKSIEIMIFRFDHPEIEQELVKAVKRGVAVQALIAYTNRGGERRLRGLETRLLAAGAVVARTNNDLARYHSKFLIVDHEHLYVLGYNFTKSDIDRSRSFGVVTTQAQLVKEASKLFNADCTRQPYQTDSKHLLVSPLNARAQLTAFLRDAKKELLIYDLEVSDKAMLETLKERTEAGVQIRVIGEVKPVFSGLTVRYSHPLRLHARVLVRDGEWVFLGSQSLRRLELDHRRELGIVFHDASVAEKIVKTFEQDWKSSKEASASAEKVAKKVAKAVARDMAPVGPMLDQMVAKNGQHFEVDHESLQQIVKEAVKTAVRDAVHEAVTQDAVTES